MKYQNEIKLALKHGMGVFMGYNALGFAFGLLATNYNYAWYIALIMSIFIYTGALQFAAITFLSAKLALVDIAIASFFINI